MKIANKKGKIFSEKENLWDENLFEKKSLLTTRAN